MTSKEILAQIQDLQKQYEILVEKEKNGDILLEIEGYRYHFIVLDTIVSSHFLESVVRNSCTNSRIGDSFIAKSEIDKSINDSIYLIANQEIIIYSLYIYPEDKNNPDAYGYFIFNFLTDELEEIDIEFFDYLEDKLRLLEKRNIDNSDRINLETVRKDLLDIPY